MSKGKDTQHREDKKKPSKTLKEKRAEKSAKKSGAFSGSAVNSIGDKTSSR